MRSRIVKDRPTALEARKRNTSAPKPSTPVKLVRARGGQRVAVVTPRADDSTDPLELEALDERVEDPELLAVSLVAAVAFALYQM